MPRRTPERFWTGPVLVHHLNDARAIGPFPDAAAATRWLRRIPNALFGDAKALEHARGNGDVNLMTLEEPADTSELPPCIDYPKDWKRSWDPDGDAEDPP